MKAIPIWKKQKAKKEVEFWCKYRANDFITIERIDIYG